MFEYNTRTFTGLVRFFTVNLLCPHWAADDKGKDDRLVRDCGHTDLVLERKFKVYKYIIMHSGAQRNPVSKFE